MKETRIENPELLRVIRKIPCMACISMRQSLTEEEWESLYSLAEDLDIAMDASDPDHVTTRGAGGDDVPENLIPLCRMHHTERHDQGWGHMIEEYGAVKLWLALAGRADVFERAGLPVPDSCKDAQPIHRSNDVEKEVEKENRSVRNRRASRRKDD